MYPSLITQDIEQALKEFIVTGFETETPHFKGKFHSLMHTDASGEAFFKGPYMSIGLPFYKAPNASQHVFSAFATEHSPFAHQETAWQRLRSDAGNTPQPTLVATGTGSGKTECFLYPLLNHCLHNAKPGIKAIIIYPMNALATDQAKRFAEVIHDTPELNGKVNVGLFVGGADNDNTGEQTMSRESVITSKSVMRQNPPDILLTNYKMLDYLLMRPKDQTLWRYNQPDTLQYLVVDELHTFDGAQGSDLAMLIRRLKAHLKVPNHHLVSVGTSATIGSDDARPRLIEFISQIFDTPFDDSAIIGETRVSPSVFQRDINYVGFSYDFEPEKLSVTAFRDEVDYLRHQAWFFFGKKREQDESGQWIVNEEGFDLEPNDMASRQALGEALKRHALFHKLLSQAQSTVALSVLLPEARQLPPGFRPYAGQILASLLALVSFARGQDYPGQPFVSLRFQSWARELKRIVADVAKTPDEVHLHFSDDLKAEHDGIVLPVVQCSECHSTAWLAGEKKGEPEIERDLRTLYNLFFDNNVKSLVLLPLEEGEQAPAGYGTEKQLCSGCGHLSLVASKRCQACGSEQVVRVFESSKVRQVKESGANANKKERSCPVCQANNSLILFGSQAASLTSVAINQLFSNTFNHDKKLIAFSDSVQDAAHRAGFYSARTWEMNLRIAMAQYIHNHRCQTGQDLSYTDFINHWYDAFVRSERNPEGWEDVHFISEFIAPNLTSEDAYISMTQGRQVSLEHLLALVKQRLSWEALQEVGIRSQIGRSLDRTGTAVLSWPAHLVSEAATEWMLRLENQLGHSIDQDAAERALWGLLLQMRRRGAIFHEELVGFIGKGGDYFILTKKSYLPNFGSHSTLPRFPATDREKGFEAIVPKQGRSWYLDWLSAQLGDIGLVDNKFYQNAFNEAMKALVLSGLVATRITEKDHQVWGLNAEVLSITDKLAPMVLKRNSDGIEQGRTFIPADWIYTFERLAMPSLVLHKGDDQTSTWRAAEAHKQNFYRQFYLSGEVSRVIGHEHTGLLSRSLREAVENRFKAKQKDRKPWFENLLSATPTLEMGIDIGDLSSVLLASVPPSQASYLQRIGRAGRSTGNATVLTVANGHPHDLYFYADPMTMMAGEVEPPAIFLEASMVLRRQLLAYCFDDWGRVSQGKHTIPTSMQSVINNLNLGDTARFPFTLVNFIRENRDRLWDEFVLLLPPTLSEDALGRLRELLVCPQEEEQQVEWLLLNRLKELSTEVSRLDAQSKEMDKALKVVQAKPQDEVTKKEMAELEEEIHGLRMLKRNIFSKDTLNFLTDEGLLPNYAFPEEGTTLKSVIYRKSAEPNAAEPYKSDTYEYTRPAHSAIRELAPNSVFYASNHKVTISRVETAKGKAIEYIRMCPSCSYNERVFRDPNSAVMPMPQSKSCPRCGSAGWAGVQQTFPILRLEQVYARSSIKDATLGDDKDTREPVFFNQQMLVDVEPDQVELAYAFAEDSKPFGFEFVRKATFMEVNFGETGANDDRVFEVAGKELERPGFRICADCGTVQPKRGRAEHTLFCKHKKAEGAEGIVQCLYLYREYVSEAIRILMPSMSVGTDQQQTQSFVAAVQLGLKKRFGGKVDHLQMMVSDQPIPNSDRREKYLVIYDSVPGGTGYLHELLADPNNLIETFKAAQQVMVDCGCQHVVPEVDGCYSCLYAYRNSFGMESTSRMVALTMLNEILEGDETLKPIDHLGNVKKVIWEDSLLEQKFPEALKAVSGKSLVDGKKVTVKMDLIKGKKAYHLTFGDQVYRMEMHVRLGDEEGIAYACEPDYVIYPVKVSQPIKPIAIFLDGYEYHHDCVHEDLLKRQSLLLSGKYWVWSLNWYDVDQQFALAEMKSTGVFESRRNKTMTPILQRAAQGLTRCQLSDLQLNSFGLLAKFLCNAAEAELTKLAALQFLGLANKDNRNTQTVQSWQESLGVIPQGFQDQVSSRSFTLAECWQWQEGDAKIELRLACEDAFIATQTMESYAIVLQVKLAQKGSEESKKLWRDLWQLMNWVQFAGCLYAGEQQATKNGVFSQLTWGQQQDYIDPAWQNVLDEVADEGLPFIEIMIELNFPIPVVGFELTGAKGAVLAEGELVWEDAKIALLLPDQEDDGALFEQHGFQIHILEDGSEEYIRELRDTL
jgi:DEAD/DEAH box helicase domain-containing protein